MEQHASEILQVPPLPSEGWERVPEGRVRALMNRYRVAVPDRDLYSRKQRALIRPLAFAKPELRFGGVGSATFSHAARRRRGNNESAPARIVETR